MTTKATDRHFLFLQGPHGPFFGRLGRILERAGARVYRVGFNKGDEFFWPDASTFFAFRDAPDTWPGFLRAVLADQGITDIVLYGDTRPIHAAAIEAAKAMGLRAHVFEEGYLRPYWVTYERGGTNGHSRLMGMDLEQMRDALDGARAELHEVPASWGDMRQHVFYGALYHFFVLFRNQAYPQFRPHRQIDVKAEFRLHLAKLFIMPFKMLRRVASTLRVKLGGFPYHIALLQLEHDASFRAHSGFNSQTEFVKAIIDGFSVGAAGHQHLVFKAHPLEDGRVPLRRDITRLAAEYGVADRVHFIVGGKLGSLLDGARSAVTVNSTAGQQALWRGLPLKVFGEAVYNKPEFVSDQPLPAFFADPKPPNLQAYKDFRGFILATSQVPGGFYSSRGRRQLLRQAVDLMLADTDPYDALTAEGGVASPQLSALS